MPRDVHDLIHLRWRTAQLLLAVAEGEGDQVRALRIAMRNEGITAADRSDEIRLLWHQFGRRPQVVLRQEISRLWRQLRERCVRCGRANRHLDSQGVCVNCVIGESS